MQADLFDCSICCCGYNRGANIPKILPNCGHTVCASCLEQILQGKQPSLCPLDRAVISNEPKSSKTFPTNLFVLQMLDERAKMDATFCSAHREPKTLICKKDLKSICRFCVENGEHKGHETMKIDEVKAEANGKRAQLEAKRGQFQQKDYDRMYEILASQEENVNNMLLSEAERWKEMIMEKVHKVMSNVEEYYGDERKKLDVKYRKDFRIKERLDKAISVLDSNNIDEEFYKAMAYQESEEFTVSLEHLLKSDVAYKTVNSFKNSLKEIEKLILQVSSTFDSLPALMKPLIKDEEATTLEDFLRFSLEDGYLKMTSQNLDNPIQKPPQGDWAEVSKLQLELSDVKFTRDLLKNFEFFFKHHVEITDLKVNLAQNDMKDEDFESLYPLVFSKCNALEAIDLNLRRSKISNLAISQFLTSLSTGTLFDQTKLKTLSLWLSNTFTQENSVKHLATQILPQLNSIQNFQLYLGGTQISDPCIAELLSALQKLPTHKIHTFALFLSDIKVSDYSLTCFAASLSTMKSLQDFQLGLHGTKTSDYGFEKVISSLRPIAVKIHTLSLYLGQTKISDSSMKTLAKEIMPNMGALNNLTIDLNGLTQISDSSMTKLFAGMEKTTQNLKNLTLYLGGCKVGDKTAEALGKSVLSHLNRLENLTLNLANTKVKDPGMVDLFANMGLVLEKLKGFVMILSATKVSDVTVFALNKQLYAISAGALERFRLVLEETQVTDGGIQEFCQIITKYRASEKPLQSFDVLLNMTKINGQTVELVNETRRKLLGIQRRGSINV